MSQIQNSKYTIQDAFQNCSYIVPDYQREYVWSEKEVTQLLEDIGEQAGSSDSEYFIGTILVAPQEERDRFEVIDGQQRLTTFYLLLCAMQTQFEGQSQRDTIKGLLAANHTDEQGNISKRLKLEPRYENAAEIMRLITEADGDPEEVRAAISSAGITNYGSLENLVAAYGTVYRYLADNYGTFEELKKLWGHLANKVVFIQISTDVGHALKIFETINERGVGLNPMDLLKNLLFSQVSSSQFSELKDEWKKVTKPLEQAGQKPLRFLRYFLMANFVIKGDGNDPTVREDQIYDWFVTPENAELAGYKDEPFVFVRSLVRNVELYVGFTNGFTRDNQPSPALGSLKQLTGGAFSLHFVLLLAAAPLPKDLFDHFVAQLESFLFFYIFTKSPTKELERSFSLWADEIREVSSISDSELQFEKLNEFLELRFQKGISEKRSELEDSLGRLALYSMQKYRIRYLLSRMTEHVEMAFRGMRSRGSLDQFASLEIEHILPDTPEKVLSETWKASNPADAEYDDYKNKLGNLTLLEKPINIVAGNDYYNEKTLEYAKCGNYLTRSLVKLESVGENSSINRINTKLQSFSEWSAESIECRQQMLIDLTPDIWKIRPFES